jgi:hypothetical protein
LIKLLFPCLLVLLTQLDRPSSSSIGVGLFVALALALASNFDVDFDVDAGVAVDVDAEVEENAEEVDPKGVEEDPRFAADEAEAEKVDPASREGLTTSVLLLLCPGL